MSMNSYTLPVVYVHKGKLPATCCLCPQWTVARYLLSMSTMESCPLPAVYVHYGELPLPAVYVHYGELQAAATCCLCPL